MSSSDHDQLSRRLLQELSSLNYRFVQLVLDSADPVRADLPDPVYQRLLGLDEADHRRLASCPYSLFELRLDSPETWQRWLDTDAVAGQPSTAHHFTLAVMMYTRQLAVENADLGRMLLGLAPRVAEQFRRSSIGRLMDIAPVVSKHLRVRLIDDPRFWPDLVNYVKDGTQEQYLAAQTSALQIMAAQL
jgi:hypothetical protein